jgi:hypothetical protein
MLDEGAEPGGERGGAQVLVQAGEGARGAERVVAALGEVQARHPAHAFDHADQGRAVVDPRGKLVARHAGPGSGGLEFGREQG